MNNYPIWWDKTITVYNRYEDSQTQLVKWYRTTISNCFVKVANNKINVGDTLLETNNTICRVPKQSNFLEKYEWVQLPNDIKGNFVTFGIGDFIVLGAVDDDVDEYVAGHRSNDIKAKYHNLQGCIDVEKVANNTGAGRCNEHYLVTGV